VKATSTPEIDELVGRVPHRAHDNDDAMPLLAAFLDARGTARDPRGVADRGAAELLDEDCHGREGM
jgi:hypothetical protein